MRLMRIIRGLLKNGLPVLVTLWVSIVLAFFVNLQTEELRELLGTAAGRIAVAAGLVALAIATVCAFKLSRREQQLTQFELFKPADELTPADAGFEFVKANEAGGEVKRPFYPLTYIGRIGIFYGEGKPVVHDGAFDENGIASQLSRGDSVLIVGTPGDGKTRTLYECVKRLDNHHVVRLRRDQAPSDDAVALAENKKIVILVDDLHLYMSVPIDLLDIERRIRRVASSCVIAATCSDGPEFAEVMRNGSPLARFADAIGMRLTLVRPTREQKEQLKRALKLSNERDYATLGAICTSRCTEAMLRRFSAMEADERNAFRAVQLLSAAGIEPLTGKRILKVVSEVFGCNLGRQVLRDCLHTLKGSGFIVSIIEIEPDWHVVPERDYVVGQIADELYRGRASEDLQRLAQCMMQHKDAEALRDMAYSAEYGRRNQAAGSLWSMLVSEFGSLSEPPFTSLVVEGMVSLGRLESQEGGDKERAMCWFSDVLKSRFASEETLAVAQFNHGLLQLERNREEAIADFKAVIANRKSPLGILGKAILHLPQDGVLPLSDSVEASATPDGLARLNIYQGAKWVDVRFEIAENFFTEAIQTVQAADGLRAVALFLRALVRYRSGSKGAVQDLSAIFDLTAPPEELIVAAEAWSQELLKRDAERKLAGWI